jgi:hypothetical protein
MIRCSVIGIYNYLRRGLQKDAGTNWQWAIERNMFSSGQCLVVPAHYVQGTENCKKGSGSLFSCNGACLAVFSSLQAYIDPVPGCNAAFHGCNAAVSTCNGTLQAVFGSLQPEVDAMQVAPAH